MERLSVGHFPVLSGDGRFVAFVASVEQQHPPSRCKAFVRDRVTGQTTPVCELFADCSTPLSISQDGRFVAFAGRPDVTSPVNVFRTDLDADGDGMHGAWETFFGLNPNDPLDAFQDPDGDGVQHAQEFATGGHPTTNPAFSRFFAEGAAGFFATHFSVFNAGPTSAVANLHFLGAQGRQTGQLFALSPGGRLTIDSNSVSLPDGLFSTVLETTAPLVVDRTMVWGVGGYGSHAVSSVNPSFTWYLTEGHTGPFDLFYLFENPQPRDAAVTVEYFREPPLAQVTRSYIVRARSRRTVWVNQEGPDLTGHAISASIRSSESIVVERAMYLSALTRPFLAGSASTGVNAPSRRWFFAEGITGAVFDTFLLLANPGDVDATATVTYLRPDGLAPIEKTHVVPSRSRITVRIDDEDAELASTPVSTKVTATREILAERAIWWPGSGATWTEVTSENGATEAGTVWAVAGGVVDPGYFTDSFYASDTFLLIANTGPSAGRARVTLYFEDVPQVSKLYELAAESRTTVWVRQDFPAAIGRRFSMLVESIDTGAGLPPLVVEWALYGSSFQAGAASLATKLQ